MNADDLAPALRPDFRRDRWGRPLVAGKPYGRPSSHAKTIEDTYGLELWSKRNVAFGMAHDASLVARVLALPSAYDAWSSDDKAEANKIADAAQAVAKAHKAADIGTALHRMTERIDLGEKVDGGPFQADLDAYRAAMAPLEVRPDWIECRMVCHELELAGTADRLVHHDGHWFVADVKTGASLDYAGLGYATQLAVYAHSVLWDIDTDAPVDTPPLNIERALIIHLPAGRGECHLMWVDIAEGWEVAHLATKAKRAQKRKGWFSPASFAAPTVHPSAVVEQPAVGDHGTAPTAETVKARLAELPDDVAAMVRAELKQRQITTARPAAALQVLEEIAAFQTAQAEPVTTLDNLVEPFPPAPPESTGPDEGDKVGTAERNAIKAAHDRLTPEGQAWVKQIVGQARAAKVPISLSSSATVRRFEIARGLMLIADAADDETLRALVHLACGSDAVLFANVTPGAALGSLSAAEAERFARHCDAFVHGRLAAHFDGDGVLRLDEGAAA